MPTGRIKRKTTISTARKVWSWLIVAWLCPDCFWSRTFVRSCGPDNCGSPATPHAVTASQLARSEVAPYTLLHEIPRSLKASVSQIGRLAARLESPPRQEKRTSPTPHIFLIPPANSRIVGNPETDRLPVAGSISEWRVYQVGPTRWVGPSLVFRFGPKTYQLNRAPTP